MKVLIIDDEEEFATTLGERLGIRGYDTRVAKTFQEGLKHIESYGPDVVIADLHLPDGSGVELLRLARGHLPAAKLFLASGQSGTSLQVEEALSNGCCKYFTKPFVLEDFLELL